MLRIHKSVSNHKILFNYNIHILILTWWIYTYCHNCNVAYKLVSKLKLHNVGWSRLGAIRILSCDVMTQDTFKNVVFSWECTLLSTITSNPVTDKSYPNAIGRWSESVLNHFPTNLLHVVNNEAYESFYCKSMADYFKSTIQCNVCI